VVQGDGRHSNPFLICDDCGQVQEIELPQVEKTIDEKAQAAGFKPARWSAEIHGTCRACQD
jgi:Fur family zinc uptake transcriptional regulator